MAISSVEKLSDRKNYEYTSEQSTQIIEALENSLEALKLGFAKTNHEAPKTFEFK